MEFSDLQCPFCREYAKTTFVQLKQRWIDTGKLQYVSRDFPLDFHAHAMNAARASRCSGDQGKFWEMRLALVQNANLLSSDYIAQVGRELNLDMKVFTGCVASSQHDDDIRGDIEEGKRIGITGTPTFVIGRTHGNGALEGPVITGAVPYSVLDAQLSELLETGAK